MRSNLCVLLETLLLMTALFGFVNPEVDAYTYTDYVGVENGKFTYQGNEMGINLYPAHSANYEYITRTLNEARANGFTAVRAVDILQI